MDLRNSNGFELRNFYLYNRIEAFFENFHQKWKNVSIQVLPNQVSKKSFHTFEDIDLRESHAKLHKKTSETLGAD